jgi:alkylation response protein AidB-like acyl-CoA dehydrogenase
MMAGETSLALAWAERRARYDAHSPATRAKKDGGGYRIDGEKVFVENGHAADQLVVSAALDGGLALFVVDRATAGVTVQPVQLIDGRRGAMARFEGVLVDGDRLLGDASDAARVLDHAIDYGAAAAVAEGLGVVTTMLNMTLGYLREREQFGAPIGSFQALQHRAVDMFVEQQLLHAVNVLACVRADERDPAIRKPDLSAAKVQLATGGKLVAQQAIQLHGGIGITDEHDIGLYFKRLQALNALYGDLEHHTQRFMSAPGFA